MKRATNAYLVCDDHDLLAPSDINDLSQVIGVHVVSAGVTRVGLSQGMLDKSHVNSCRTIIAILTTRINEVLSSIKLSICSTSHSQPRSGKQSYSRI